MFTAHNAIEQSTCRTACRVFLAYTAILCIYVLTFVSLGSAEFGPRIRVCRNLVQRGVQRCTHRLGGHGRAEYSMSADRAPFGPRSVNREVGLFANDSIVNFGVEFSSHAAEYAFYSIF